jgi:hypothetical protein
VSDSEKEEEEEEEEEESSDLKTRSYRLKTKEGS